MKIARLPNGSPEVFHTLQGEGITAGVPAVFVRASLCNLHCVWCDTDYTWNWEGTPWPHDKDADPDYAKYRKDPQMIEMTPADVAAAIKDYNCRRLVVTGGEPLVQQEEFIDVIAILRERDPSWVVEVETNGTITPVVYLDELVAQYNVSPKLANSGNDRHLRIKDEALAFFAQSPKAWFKFVVSHPADLEEIGKLQSQLALEADRIILMPEGRDAETLRKRREWLADKCRDLGHRFSDRLQIELWGEEQGR